MFTRQHYWKLAEALSSLPNDESKYDLMLALCDLLAKDNPLFQPDLFMEVAEREAYNGHRKGGENGKLAKTQAEVTATVHNGHSDPNV